jgi:hypothetical protein
MNAPASLGTYTRLMAPMLDVSKLGPLPMGFQAFFARPVSNTIFSPDSDVVDIDIVRGNRKTAKLVLRTDVSQLLGSNQKDLNGLNYTSFARSYPLSIESGEVAASQMNKRCPGEPVHNGWTQAMRLRYWAMKQHIVQTQRTVRMFERLAAQSVISGKQDAIIGTTDANQQYDFERDSDHAITVSTAWTTAATATPIGDLDDAGNLVSVNGNVRPDFALVGADAMAAFVKTTEVKEIADNKGYEILRVSALNPVPPSHQFMIDAGFIPWGSVRTWRGYNIWLFTYDGSYEADNGTDTPILEPGTVVVGSTQSRCDRWFGPSNRFDSSVLGLDDFYRSAFGFDPSMAIGEMNVGTATGILDPRMFYYAAYPNQARNVIHTETQSAPIFATVHTDAWAVIGNAA